MQVPWGPSVSCRVRPTAAPLVTELVLGVCCRSSTRGNFDGEAASGDTIAVIVTLSPIQYRSEVEISGDFLAADQDDVEGMAFKTNGTHRAPTAFEAAFEELTLRVHASLGLPAGQRFACVLF